MDSRGSTAGSSLIPIRTLFPTSPAAKASEEACGSKSSAEDLAEPETVVNYSFTAAVDGADSAITTST